MNFYYCIEEGEDYRHEALLMSSSENKKSKRGQESCPVELLLLCCTVLLLHSGKYSNLIGKHLRGQII